LDDPLVGQLAKALYFHLVPPGGGMAPVRAKAVAARADACWRSEFTALSLGVVPRELRQAFKRLLALTVRYASQLTGQVATGFVGEYLRAGSPMTSAEKDLLELRYGACPALGDVNIGLLFGCGPLLADLVNDYGLALAGAADRARAERRLRAALSLLRDFQEKRRFSRADERRAAREARADRPPGGPRKSAADQPDRSLPSPVDQAISAEKIELLRQLMPRLKRRDARRLGAFVACGGDRAAAAKQLGLDHRTFSRQLRQTVFPAIRLLARGNDPGPAEEEDDTA
jgi:hypothetical protein